MAVYIDPSINVAGWARFIEGELQFAMFIKTKGHGLERLLDLKGQMPLAWKDETIVVEWPHMRSAGRAASPDDLITLGASAGAMVAGTGEWHHKGDIIPIKPQEWKGNLPKDVTHEHMWAILDTEEKQTLKRIKGAKKDLENMYDAVCIGLFMEGRAPWKSNQQFLASWQSKKLSMNSKVISMDKKTRSRKP